jgi:hypothetical protein
MDDKRDGGGARMDGIRSDESRKRRRPIIGYYS